ncbi:MAG TPA: pyridoxal 5'-phosphate synthase glutaminase subunit PdxT [Candidatus Diapherotrites archaeon]|uniref:Pyridoxal 5'-phosphate synthase subunit PdxT n=1 Tax=Candidatus Iainarchaeum sp. TaxID=3101447 RepID=A0A7J4IUB2_9ARCH|nr:pyridoxal 5'-phosphate synthase glutaminase subunit PdxT [Candidatus Diapherotrites archaeon]
MKPIGVLALQGDFFEHIRLLTEHDVPAIEVRSRGDLAKCSALIIPGGESTTMAHLMQTAGLEGGIKKRVAEGMPFYGTCAGAILAAKKVIGEKRYRPLGLIDICVERNAYGRQADSFEAALEVKGEGKMNGVFIRSPVIKKAGKKVEVLSSLSGKPVLVRSGNVLCGTFHPETESQFLCHKLLLKMASK